MSMTRLEHLLTIAAEECTEIGQRISKALRFTLEEVQPGQALTNAERIMYEFRDLQAVMEMLEDEGALPSIWVRDVAAIEAKKKKVEAFLAHSAEVGTLSLKAEAMRLVLAPLSVKSGVSEADLMALLKDAEAGLLGLPPLGPCSGKCCDCGKRFRCLDAGVAIPLKVQTGGRLKVGGGHE